MVWFKVDDGFYANVKIARLSMAARGLWVSAGSYCGHQLTDGVVSAKMVRQLGGTPTQIKALVEHGLWIETTDDSGSKAYAFKDWGDFNPSREKVLSDRERDAEKKREWRGRKAANQGERENVPGGQRGGQCGGRTPDGTGYVPGGVPLYPTRPDPTRPGEGRGEREGIATREVSDSLPSEWLKNPNLARCENHVGDPNPPKCHGCKAAREAAEVARDKERDAKDAQRRAARDAIATCDLCDENGWIQGHAPAIRCEHDQDANSELILTQIRESEARAESEEKAREVARREASEAMGKLATKRERATLAGPGVSGCAALPVAASKPPAPSPGDSRGSEDCRAKIDRSAS